MTRTSVGGLWEHLQYELSSRSFHDLPISFDFSLSPCRLSQGQSTSVPPRSSSRRPLPRIRQLNRSSLPTGTRPWSFATHARLLPPQCSNLPVLVVSLILRSRPTTRAARRGGAPGQNADSPTGHPWCLDFLLRRRQRLRCLAIRLAHIRRPQNWVTRLVDACRMGMWDFSGLDPASCRGWRATRAPN